jgi:hypothetical protein
MSKVLKATIKYSVKTLADRSKVTLGRSHDLRKTLFELNVKLQANVLPLLISLAVWLTGVAYYYYNEPVVLYPEFKGEEHVSIYTACVLAIGIRNPMLKTDLSNLYQLCWPIFLEVVVFGLLTTALLGNFNPKLLSKLHAKHRRNHVVVIGYSHMGQRVVEYLLSKRIPYVLVDADEKLVADLINITEPVVVVSYSLQYLHLYLIVLREISKSILRSLQHRSSIARKSISCAMSFNQVSLHVSIFVP